MKLASFFKRKYRYAPIEYMGRKQVQEILGAKIIKFRKLRDPNETLESSRQNP